jgi:hypothetical protein
VSGLGDGADLHGYATHGGTRRPLVRWEPRRVRGSSAPTRPLVGSAEGIKFACRRYAPRFRGEPKRRSPAPPCAGYFTGDLQRFPSSIYWAGLGTWNIRRFTGSQNEYHDSLDVYYQLQQEKEDRVADMPPPNWDPTLPDPPDDLPDTASFDLRREDAEDLQDCTLTGANGAVSAAGCLQASSGFGSLLVLELSMKCY